MRVEKETMYVDPLYEGGSSIVDVPMNVPINSNVVYGANPNLVTNEFGQTMVNPDVPVPINPPTSTPTSTPTNFLTDAVESVKEMVADITNANTTSTTTGATSGGATGGTSGTQTPPKANATTNSNAQALIKDLKQVQSTKDAKIKPKTNYLLYGLIGVGALVVVMGVFKKK